VRTDQEKQTVDSETSRPRLRPAEAMPTIGVMSDEHIEEPRPAAEKAEAEDGPPASEPRPSGAERSAADDLAQGLELVLRAARKAVRRIDPARIEEAGKRALSSLEGFDAKKARDLGRRAAKNLDPRKLEEIAEDAGKELLSVVERVADRVENIVGTAARSARSEPPRAGQPPAAGADEPPPRVRVEDEGKH